MRETTSSQLVMWMEYLAEDVNAFDPIKHYLAKIAFEVRRSFVKDPNAVDFDEFLLKFETEVEKKTTKRTEAEKQNNLLRSKAFWFGGLGIGKGE